MRDVIIPFQVLKVDQHSNLCDSLKMAVRANANAMAQIVTDRPLFFIHCVANEDIILIPHNFSCVQVVCREIHVSLPEKLSVRRVALTPTVVNGKPVAEMFDGVRSPALVHVDCSCDFKASFIF